MPLYEFRCPACGPVELRRAAADAGAPAACPVCSTALSRVFSSPPRPLDAVRRAAGDIHERSAHAPRSVSGASIGHGHSHGGHSGSRPWQLSS